MRRYFKPSIKHLKKVSALAFDRLLDGKFDQVCKKEVKRILKGQNYNKNYGCLFEFWIFFNTVCRLSDDMNPQKEFV